MSWLIFGLSFIYYLILSAKEWRDLSPDEIQAEIQRYRDEPLFVKVMTKLKFSWDDIDKIVKEAT